MCDQIQIASDPAENFYPLTARANELKRCLERKVPCGTTIARKYKPHTGANDGGIPTKPGVMIFVGANVGGGIPSIPGGGNRGRPCPGGGKIGGAKPCPGGGRIGLNIVGGISGRGALDMGGRMGAPGPPTGGFFGTMLRIMPDAGIPRGCWRRCWPGGMVGRICGSGGRPGPPLVISMCGGGILPGPPGGGNPF